MTLPVRRHRAGGLAERRFPGWRDPLTEFDDLFDRMGRLLESTVGGFAPTAERMAWAPSADTYETDDAYVIEVDVPGVKRDDLDIELDGQELIITGELKEREREGTLRRSTRRAGRFEYRTVLPGELDPESVKATLADGVLTVKIAKAAAAKPRHIEIVTED